MSLDELLKEKLALLEQAKKLRPFGPVDDRAVNFPEEQRQRRLADLKARIEDLSHRKEEAVASYDRAIELEKAELESLTRQRSPIPETKEETTKKF